MDSHAADQSPSEVKSPAELPAVSRYPRMAAETGRIEPAPRRVRAYLGGRKVFDTTSALYVWE